MSDTAAAPVSSIPDGVAMPQDHAPKQDTVKPSVERTAEGFTVKHRGLTLSIPVDALNDFEMLRDLGTMQDPATPDAQKMAQVPQVFTRFFGSEQSGVVLNALRDPETKRVRVEVASGFLFEVIKALNPES